MTHLTGTVLANDRIAEVYPLIRAAAGITPRQWTAFGRLLSSRGGKVMVVVDETGRIYGAAAFRRGSTLRHDNSLIVDALAAFELGERGSVKRVLCAALKAEAESRGCTTLVVQAKPTTSLGREQDILGWAELGLELEGITMVQNIDRAGECSLS